MKTYVFVTIAGAEIPAAISFSRTAPIALTGLTLHCRWGLTLVLQAPALRAASRTAGAEGAGLKTNFWLFIVKC